MIDMVRELAENPNIAARACEAAARGTPVLVTHAGRMSRPILDRLGFEPIAHLDRLIDRLV